MKVIKVGGMPARQGDDRADRRFDNQTVLVAQKDLESGVNAIHSSFFSTLRCGRLD